MTMGGSAAPTMNEELNLTEGQNTVDVQEMEINPEIQKIINAIMELLEAEGQLEGEAIIDNQPQMQVVYNAMGQEVTGDASEDIEETQVIDLNPELKMAM